MGVKAHTIIGMDADALIQQLNKAYADEWLAYFQYETAARQVRGLIRKEVEHELKEHAREEYEHAMLLADRIIQLGGMVLLTPEEIIKEANCAYIKPGDACLSKIVDQTIISERCAIAVYKRLADLTREKEPITFHLAIQILKDELDHEEDFQNFRADLDAFCEKVKTGCKTT